tara:strand:- start:1261 stop:1425 length:165 start_codon:yes stop_codon:yes gene_type:complete
MKARRHAAKIDPKTNTPINGQSRCGGIGVWTTTSDEQVSCPLCMRFTDTTEEKD